MNRAAATLSPALLQNRPVAARVRDREWDRLAAELDEQGIALIRGLLARDDCLELGDLYRHDSIFRSRIVMARHGFGKGEYKYFRYPLPDVVQHLRAALFPPLAAVANGWNEALKIDERYPQRHEEYLERCHAAGQSRATPLMLDYGPGDYNCLHQDLYGERIFPLQAAILLSQPQKDFSGGEFVLTEQRPRMQSRVEVVPLEQGDAVIFAVHQRPVKGTRGHYRVNMRHGVSRVHGGHRRTLGIIFHDAR